MSVPENFIKNVGISAIEVYFPRNAVNQSDMEEFDGCSVGKYTIGLGQEQMGFCADNEDVVSISLTVTESLLRNYEIDPNSIGFLAVGTETIIDKSKSVKTELMRLFGDNSDIEGVDVKNACYGGTQAVFHAIDWIYANYLTEKRNAIVVLADIAVYEAGPARCTGGAGSIAVLITPDAPIAFDRGLRATYMTGTWDFYKPIGKYSTEYPTVDGPLSLKCYMNSLDACYWSYKKKAAKLFGENISLSSFSAVMFHSPFSRMAQKGLARLAYRDYESGKLADSSHLAELGVICPSSFEDRDVMRCLLRGSESLWREKTHPYLELNRRIGNMYTPSLFAQLVVYLASGSIDKSDRILFFAYGSGSASAMFSASVNASGMLLDKMREISRLAIDRLEERLICTPQTYAEALIMRENLLASNVPVMPKANCSDPSTLNLFPGTYFLTLIDEKNRRCYSRVPNNVKHHMNGIVNGIGENVKISEHT